MAASTQDSQAPFDTTGYSSVSGAQLKQLIDGVAPYTDKGLVIATEDVAGVPDVPDAATTTKWQNYIWLRIGATSVTPYIWNDNGANHLDGAGNSILKWYTIASASIGVGTITNDMIADNTIQSIKIVSLEANKLTGSLPAAIADTLVEVGSAAGGDLSGTYPDPSLAADAVGTSNIVDLAVTNAKVQSVVGGSETTTGLDVTTKLRPNTVGLTQPRTNAGATAVEWFVPKKIEALTDPASAADVGKVVVVTSPYTDGYVLELKQTIQRKMVLISTADSTATTIDYDASIPQNTEGKEYITLGITPTSATSILHVTFVGWVSGSSASATNAIVALFRDAGADALQTTSGIVESTTDIIQVTLDYYVVAGSTVATTFKVRFGPSTGTAYMNQSASVVLFGGTLKSYLMVEEITATLT